jgi:hypothetical protein
MLHIYAFHRHDVSEDMLLGLGAGLGFLYWHAKGTDPFFGGRANVARPGEEGLEITAGRRTGVRVERHHTSSARVAQRTLLEQLEAGNPVMLLADMGFLPYFTQLPQDFHFGHHMIVTCGLDGQTGEVLVADRDEPLHTVSLEDLARARGSKFKPFPPGNTWFTFDFSQKRPPNPEEVRQAMKEVCTTMLEGPISNLGVRGIRKAAQRVLDWPATMSGEELRRSCFNTFIFIDASGGTGGGIFRYMYARFLREAAEILGDPHFAELGDDLRSIGDSWQEVAEIFKRASKPEADAVGLLAETTDPLSEIADREAALWSELSRHVSQTPG